MVLCSSLDQERDWTARNGCQLHWQCSRQCHAITLVSQLVGANVLSGSWESLLFLLSLPDYSCSTGQNNISLCLPFRMTNQSASCIEIVTLWYALFKQRTRNLRKHSWWQVGTTACSSPCLLSSTQRHTLWYALSKGVWRASGNIFSGESS